MVACRKFVTVGQTTLVLGTYPSFFLFYMHVFTDNDDSVTCLKSLPEGYVLVELPGAPLVKHIVMEGLQCDCHGEEGRSWTVGLGGDKVT